MQARCRKFYFAVSLCIVKYMYEINIYGRWRQAFFILEFIVFKEKVYKFFLKDPSLKILLERRDS